MNTKVHYYKLQKRRPRFYHERPYFSSREYVQANNHVSFEINEGNLQFSRSSGSGKSTIARVITGLYPPHEGQIIFEGIDFDRTEKPKRERRPFRRAMQMVFQNPYSSLNPRMKVADIIAEPIRFHNLGGK